MGYIIAGAILIVVGIIWIVCGVVHKKQEEIRLQELQRDYVPQFETLSYFRGGSEEGEIYRLSLDDRYRMKLVSCENNKSKLIERDYEVDAATYREIDAVVEEYHLKEWKRLPFIDNSAQKDGTIVLRIRYKDKSLIDIGTMQQLPPRGIPAMEKVREILERNLNRSEQQVE